MQASRLEIRMILKEALCLSLLGLYGKGLETKVSPLDSLFLHRGWMLTGHPLFEGILIENGIHPYSVSEQ